jgi:hypothetical protein
MRGQASSPRGAILMFEPLARPDGDIPADVDSTTGYTLDARRPG